MGSPLIVLTASNTEASEWRHSTGRPRDPKGMKPFDRDIVPGFETVRGLDMIDAAPVRLSREAAPG